MPKRPLGAVLPLLGEPDSVGITRRALAYKTFLQAILNGRAMPGTRLPSSRQLAADWRMSRSTIDDALAQLHGEGFLVRGVGDGTYVASRLPAGYQPATRIKQRPPSSAGRTVLQQLSAWGRSTLTEYAPHSLPGRKAFWAGLPDLELFPLDLWQRLIQRRIRGSGRTLLNYFPTMGFRPLREAAARHLALTRGVNCTAEQVMILNSTIQALDLIARTLTEPGERVWIEDPSYPNVRAALTMSGAKPVPVPVDEAGLDVARGVRLAPDAALVCISPARQYPTGVSLSLARRLQLLSWAHATGAWIVEDDYHSEFHYDGQAPPPVQSLDHGGRVIHVGTFSDLLFPSLRLAYMVLPEPLTPVFEAVRNQLDNHTHGLMQAVLADFMDGGHFSAHVRRTRSVYQSRRDVLVACCRHELPDSVRLGDVHGGLNALLYLSDKTDDTALVERALQAGIRLMPLSRYAAGRVRRQGLLLGYGALNEKEIKAGIKTLAQLLRDKRAP